MKYILSFIILFVSLYACTGDCASCHYNLDYKKDERHSPMLDCKTCHTKEKMSSINMGDTCGEDCFACHNAEKLQSKELKKAHGVIIDSCMQCHKNLVKETLDKSFMKQGIIHQNFFNQSLESK
ncbi:MULTISPECIES: hypothetical protein [unclassified Helicobacter]|uniref:hypothetical protein n=1 Tax=unclassified Helicobacter TaxID=2593540 RepID=UPI000CF11806|nr:MULTISPECIES: hypothetical protein [unclassified Helicobacter]